MNSYEIENFDKLKTNSQIVFEDLLMVLVFILIYSGTLTVHSDLTSITKDELSLWLSIGSTVSSILLTLLYVYIESQGLHE